MTDSPNSAWALSLSKMVFSEICRVYAEMQRKNCPHWEGAVGEAVQAAHLSKLLLLGENSTRRDGGSHLPGVYENCFSPVEEIT